MGLKSRETKKKKKQKEREMTGASREDKASIREEFMVTLKLNGLQPTRLLCPWYFPGKSTGVGCHCLLREIKYPEEMECCFCLPCC